jgi:hypothetical protein
MFVEYLGKENVQINNGSKRKKKRRLRAAKGSPFASAVWSQSGEKSNYTPSIKCVEKAIDFDSLNKRIKEREIGFVQSMQSKELERRLLEDLEQKNNRSNMKGNLSEKSLSKMPLKVREERDLERSSVKVHLSPRRKKTYESRKDR